MTQSRAESSSDIKSQLTSAVTPSALPFAIQLAVVSSAFVMKATVATNWKWRMSYATCFLPLAQGCKRFC